MTIKILCIYQLHHDVIKHTNIINIVTNTIISSYSSNYCCENIYKFNTLSFTIMRMFYHRFLELKHFKNTTVSCEGILYFPHTFSSRIRVSKLICLYFNETIFLFPKFEQNHKHMGYLLLTTGILFGVCLACFM